MIMKNIFSLCLAILLVFSVSAQTHTNTPIAHAGSEGVYLDLATDYPPGLEKPISGFIIERKTSGDKRWTKVVEFDVAATKNDFLANLTKANAFTPDFIAKSSVPTDAIWKAIENQQSLDSIPVWRNTLLVKLALGMSAYDGTAPLNMDITYRITRKYADGATELYAESNPVRLPGNYTYGGINWVKTSSSNEAISMQYTITGNEPPIYFRVLRSESETGNYIPVHCTRSFIKVEGKTQLIFIDDQVIANHLYYYRIVPIDTYGATGDTTEITGAAAYDPKQIAPPYDLQVNYTFGKPGLTFSWNIKSTNNIRGYNIYRGTSDAGPFEKIGFASVMDTSFHDNNALPLTTYFYYLETIDRLGNTLSPSGRIPGIYRSEIVPMPPMLTATSVQGGVQLEMTLKTKNIRGYRIYRCTGNDTAKLLISDLVAYNDKGNTIYVDKSAALNGSTFYTYYACAESNSYVLSTFSNAATARPLIATKPFKPLNALADGYDNFVMISWKDADPENIRSHEIYRADAGSQSFTKIGDSKGSRYVDSNALSGVAYNYKIISQDIFGGQSDPVIVTTISHIAKQTSSSPVSIIGYSSNNIPVIEWQGAEADKNAQIKIYRRDAKSKSSAIATVSCADKTWKDTQVVKGQTYYYSISIVTNGAESILSEEVGITVY